MKHLKKALCAALLAALLATGIQAANQNLEPYTLSYNSSYNGSHEGIRAGWTLDNRAGPFRQSIFGGYEYLRDESPLRASSLYRDLNRTDEGKVVMETRVSFRTGFDGLRMQFTTSDGDLVYSLETDNNAFYVQKADGTRTQLFAPSETTSHSFHFIITLDFESQTAHTIIDGTDYGTTPLLADRIDRFAFTTTPEDVLTIVPSGLKLVANYTLHDDFTYYTGSAKQIPYGWTSSNFQNAYVQNTLAYVKNGASLQKSFERATGKQAFDLTYFAEAGSTASFTLSNGNTAVLTVTSDGNTIYCNNTPVYEDTLENFWYRIRAELDLDVGTVDFKLNGRVLETLDLLSSETSIDHLTLSAPKGSVQFDEIRLGAITDPDDYVPEPVIPTDSDNNIVGLNVCSLWAYTSGHGWSCVTPYDEVRPVLGYYDEGSAETADWEIKFLTEHGVDFQAFCWYADNSNGPLKNTRHSIHLHDGFMNARYSDKMKYCLIWEAANGAHPANANAFRSYFVPFWIENYFKDERYMTIDNKPLLLVFGVNNFINDMGSAAACKTELDYLRGEVKKLGFDDLIILASHATDSDTLVNAGLDGCYAYNWGTSGYDVDYSIGRITACADIGKTYTVPCLSTGFNSLPWSGKRYPNMTLEDYERGLMWIRDTYFETYPNKSWQERFMMLSTWNEYGEGTYIMPAEGLHGFGYLDAIRSVFTDDNVAHNDVIPTEAQLSRITKNYPQHARLLRRLDREPNTIEESLSPVQTFSFGNPLDFTVSNASNTSFGSTLRGTSKSEASKSLAYVEARDSLLIDLQKTQALRITMKVSANTAVKAYYTTLENPLYHKSSVLTWTATAGDFKSYVLDVSSLSGTLDKLRIFPADQKNVTFELKTLEALTNSSLYIDEKKVESKVFAVTRDGYTYYPFDPAQAEGYLMNLHFEWDYDTKTLSLYGDDDRRIRFTVGSSTALTQNGSVSLPCKLFTHDGLPMLPMETVCEVMGFTCTKKGSDLYIQTPDYEVHSYISTRPANEWDFTHGYTLGWTANAVMYGSDEGLSVRATDSDTRMQSGTVSFAASRYSKLEVVLSYTSTRKNDTMQCFFITDKDKTWNEPKSVRLKHSVQSTNGTFVTCTLDMTQCSLWKDTITELRFDPFNSTDSEAVIRSIRLIEEPGAGKNNAFAPVSRLSLNAEDGNNPFTSNEATITIVSDPADSTNHVFKITPTRTPAYTGANLAVIYEPGVTYKLSYDILAGDIYGGNGTTSISTTLHADPRYDDPGQYGKQNEFDHVLNASRPTTNKTEWVHVDHTFTVPEYAFIRSTDSLRIYSNPETVNKVSTAVGFYIDNLVLEKTTTTDYTATIQTATRSGNTVKVTGSTGRSLRDGAIVLAALYDTEGRLCGLQFPEVGANGAFTASFSGVSNAKAVKISVWSGLRSLRPLAEAAVSTL